jgi:hypothetical protein
MDINLIDIPDRTCKGKHLQKNVRLLPENLVGNSPEYGVGNSPEYGVR